jgi:phenylacetic acid degradation protein paaN
VDSVKNPKAKELALHSEVRLIDFTGSSAFGDWLEREARQAVVFTEKAGVNPIVIESTSDFNGMVRNIAISLTLYSGQMCTTPQNIYVPAGGIGTPEGLRSADEFRSSLVAAIEKMTADPKRAIELLGTLQSAATQARLDAATQYGEALLASRRLEHPELPQARISAPAVVRAHADSDVVAQEHFGAISFVIDVADAQEGLRRAEDVVTRKGAISWSVYSLDENFVQEAKGAAARAGAHLSLNLTGAILANQSAAYSDFHVSGRNPAGNASLCDPMFVLPRFSVLQTRRFLA